MAFAVTVDPASAAEQALIEGLFQFYIYDFAEMYGGGDFDVRANGLYAADPKMALASYWSEPDRSPFVIRVDGRPAGFALLNAGAGGNAAIDHTVAEFFVMRPFRRSGAGAFAARALFTRFPGRWDLAIAAPNAAARAFWTRTVLSTPGVTAFQAATLQPNDRMVLNFTVEA